MLVIFDGYTSAASIVACLSVHAEYYIYLGRYIHVHGSSKIEGLNVAELRSTMHNAKLQEQELVLVDVGLRSTEKSVIFGNPILHTSTLSSVILNLALDYASPSF